MAEFDFDPAKLQRAGEQADDALNEVTLDAAQKRLVHELGELTGPALGIDTIPCRGMWLQAVRKWQRGHNLHAAHISTLGPAERLRAAFEIKGHFLELAQSILVDAQQRAAAQQTVDRAYSMYIAKYNKR